MAGGVRRAIETIGRWIAGPGPASGHAPEPARAQAAAEPAFAPGAVSALLEQLARPDEPDGAPPPRPGDRVDRYELLRELGRGAFGVVYEARDPELGRLVALKTLRPRRGVDPAMLRDEAEAAARLHHPNIVTVHDLGASGGRPFVVLERLRGETLEDALRRGPLPAGEAVRVATGVARGLAHAHAAGVVHCDLKPANVFLCEDGGVKLLDFGLARALGAEEAPGGTPPYMAPEQWRRERPHPRADVFAAGVVLFEALAGARPYAVEDGRSAAVGAARAPALPRRSAPPALRRAVRRAIDPDPDRRPADGGAWLDALRAAEASGRAAATRWLAAIAVAAAVALAAGAWWAARRPAPAPDEGPRVPVAVADVRNGTSDPELNGLSGMLVTSLEQSRRLAVVTRSRMFDALRQLGKEPPEVLDEPLAIEVGRSVGVKALLLATVHRFDDVYAIELRALDPARNEYLFTLEEKGRGKASVPDLIDRLSAATRERLRERAGGGAERRVAELTTASLAAYEHYFRARQAIDLRQFDKARGELDAALRVDPEFALARQAVVVLDSWTHPLGALGLEDPAAAEQRRHLADALRVAARLPDRERTALLAWSATVDGRQDEAVRLRDEAARAWPDDKEAVFWAGDVRFHQGDLAGAIPWFERALRLDPDYRLAMEHVVRALLALDRPADALPWARRWADAARDADSRRALARVWLAEDRIDEAQRAYGPATGDPPSPDVAFWLAQHGRADEAETLARRGVADAAAALRAGRAPEGDVRAAEDLLSQLLVARGRWQEAARIEGAHARARGARAAAANAVALAAGTRRPELVREAERAVRAAGDLDPGLLAHLALAMALGGDLDAARAWAERARSARGWARVPPPMPALLGAVLASRSGDAAGAAAILEAAIRSGPPEARYAPLAVLGELRERRGETDAAIETLERAAAFPAMYAQGAWCWLHPRVLYHLAAAYARRGDVARARGRLDALLALWDRPDPDVPFLRDARALRARLR